MLKGIDNSTLYLQFFSIGLLAISVVVDTGTYIISWNHEGFNW